jgi:hypothetical protein
MLHHDSGCQHQHKSGRSLEQRLVAAVRAAVLAAAPVTGERKANKMDANTVLQVVKEEINKLRGEFDAHLQQFHGGVQAGARVNDPTPGAAVTSLRDDPRAVPNALQPNIAQPVGYPNTAGRYPNTVNPNVQPDQSGNVRTWPSTVNPNVNAQPVSTVAVPLAGNPNPNQGIASGWKQVK